MQRLRLPHRGKHSVRPFGIVMVAFQVRYERFLLGKECQALRNVALRYR